MVCGTRGQAQSSTCQHNQKGPRRDVAIDDEGLFGNKIADDMFCQNMGFLQLIVDTLKNEENANEGPDEMTPDVVSLVVDHEQAFQDFLWSAIVQSISLKDVFIVLFIVRDFLEFTQVLFSISRSGLHFLQGWFFGGLFLTFPNEFL